MLTGFPLPWIFRTALQTVLLAIALLCAMGGVCSLTTRSLHKVVMWFAPINGGWSLPALREGCIAEGRICGEMWGSAARR